MNILSLTAGTGSVYAGSAARDNTLAAAWQRGGHHVTLVPLFTPTLTDEPNVSQRRVFFGGLYLQQHIPIVGRTPAVFDRLWDSAAVIRTLTRGHSVADAQLRDEALVAMLDVEQGPQRKELERLIAWLGTMPEPDIICVSSALLIGLARPLRQALGARVCCLLSDEDVVLDRLHEPLRNAALGLIRRLAGEVELFAACSRETATFMAAYFGIPPARMRVAPLGITTQDFDRALGRRAQEISRRTANSARTENSGGLVNSAGTANRGGRANSGGDIADSARIANSARLADSGHASGGSASGRASAGGGAGSAARAVYRGANREDAARPFTIGYLARIVPHKGLDQLVEAYRLLRHDRGMPAVRLEIAGALPAEHRGYFAQIEKRLHDWGYGGDYRYHGAVSRTAKVAFYAQLDAFSVPATAREPKGLSVLEAMASGVPVVQPRRGACIEAIDSTGGGLLVGTTSPDCIAEGLWQLWQDPAVRERCGDDAADEVRERFTAWHMAERMLQVFDTARRGVPSATLASQIPPPPPTGRTKTAGAGN
jgi:glycosyltransferase involved in cell wall biosynthesis